jgi:NAD(P)-dependent dehydrogenase (short-subunit alcohol dehydrogenase family)
MPPAAAGRALSTLVSRPMSEEGEYVGNSFSLAGHRVILTGAAGILGQAFAKALIAARASVLLVDRHGGALTEMLPDPKNLSDAQKIGIFAADLADRDMDDAIVAKAAEIFGAPANGLVNNAATKGADLSAFFAPDESFSPDLWREVFSINLEAPFFLSTAFAGQLRARREPGAIVNIASIYGHIAPDQRIYEGSEYLGHQIRSPAVYSASKAGVLGLTRHLASLWGRDGIRVNSVSPGGVSSGQNGIFYEKYSARVPMGRMATSNDMTGALIFLLSGASSYVTGQNWLIDGGLSAC